MAEPTVTKLEGQIVCVPSIDTRDWYAWNNLQPPGPPRFQVHGEVYVPNPGVDAILVPRVPQGINPMILLLDLLLRQAPGIWPQVFTWVPAHYRKVPAYYRQVQIFFADKIIADVPVQDVQ